MKKKLMATLLVASLAATLIAGCAAAPAPAAAPAADAPAAAEAAGGDYTFEIIVKSFQSSYWQAAVKGVEQEAAAKGVKVSCTGPNAESDIADQVNMLNSAINNKPDGIGLAACDEGAVLDSLQAAMDAGIPVVLFDSGVADAPEGSVKSLIATDNYGAGATAADNLYPALKDKIMSASAPVRIGEINQDYTGESVKNRGRGFTDKIIELAAADGKKVAVIGHEGFVGDVKGETVAEADADIIIEVVVAPTTTVDDCQKIAAPILQKEDTIGLFGSNQVAAEGILAANANLNVLGSDPASSILAAGFDAGSVIKAAIKDGTMYGAVTQSPLAMGIKTVDILCDVASGKDVTDFPTDGYWYNADNMEDDSIAPNLYD